MRPGRSRILNCRRPRSISPASSNCWAALVIVGLCTTPSVSASRLWVIGRASSSLRSRIMSSQRASRCLRLCAPLHATDTRTCSRKAWTYACIRFRNDGIDPMARVNAARDIYAALPGIWKLDGRAFGAEDGLHASATLPADRCHPAYTANMSNGAANHASGSARRCREATGSSAAGGQNSTSRNEFVLRITN